MRTTRIKLKGSIWKVLYDYMSDQFLSSTNTGGIINTSFIESNSYTLGTYFKSIFCELMIIIL